MTMERDLLRLMLWALLLPTVSFGQTPIDRVDQHTDIVQYDEVFVIGEDAWLFAGRGNVSGGQPTDTYFLAKCSANGTPLWRFGHILMPNTYWGNTSLNKAKQVSVLHDEGVLIVGVYDECDVVSGQGAVIRLDHAGEPMWQWGFTFSDFNHIPGSHAGIFDRLADGASVNHAIASEDSIIILNDDGEVLHRWLAPAQPVHCMRWENDTTLLVGAGSAVFRTHMDGTVLASVSLDNAEYIIDIRKDGDRVLALTTTMIAVLSDQLELEDWISIPTSVAPYGFVDANEEVWLSAGGALLAIGETDLQQVLFTGAGSMAYRDGLVMTASSVGHHGRFGGRMKSYRMDGTTVAHEDDVELLGTVDSISSSQYYSPAFGAIYTFRAHATVKVVNHSGNTLDRVLLSYFAQHGMAFCGTPGQTIIADGLNLSPGDTATIPFNGLYLINGPMTENSVHSETICLVAISPNDHLDIFSDDNQWCTDVTFTVPVGMEEAAAPQEMKVFPNPTAGVFDVQGTLGMPANVTLIDMTGRLLHSQQTTDGRLRMDISSLPSGLYMVRFETVAGTAVRRVSLIR